MPRERRNTFKLPQGEPIRRALKAAFRDQRARVLAAIGVGRKDDQIVPGDGPDLERDTPAMAERMTPLLALYWDQAGRALRARIGLDPDQWSVTNPHTASMIGRAAFDFCASTNATTSLALADARAKLAEELTQGIVSQGEALPSLVKRVNRIFDGAETYRARRIAASEASRAVHAAQEEAARESGVVDGFEWLLSEDACPLCHKVAGEVKRVRLGQAFAVIGDHPTYSQVRFPPLHPGCQCDLLEIVKPEYGGPESPEWGQTLIQPQQAEPKPKPTTAPIPSLAPETPKPWAVGDPPVLPGKPITERLNAWTEGDAIVEALAALGPAIQDLRRDRDDLFAKLTNARNALGRIGRTSKSKKAVELRAIVADLEARTAEANAALGRRQYQQASGETLAVLSVPEASRLALLDERRGQIFGQTEASDSTQAGADQALTMLRKITAGGAYERVRFDWALIDPTDKDQREFCRDISRGGPGNCEINITAHTRREVVAHEIGHAIEYQVPGTHDSIRAFLAHRVGDEPLQKLKDLFPDSNYRDREQGRKDHFDRYFDERAAYYTGKHYADATEILSMGIQALFEDAAGFAQKDPEFCKFTVGILRGALR